MSFECQFCKKIITTKSNLTKHQKTAKHCLKIQEELKETDPSIEVEKISYNCEYCDKQFSTKSRLNYHLQTCNLRYKFIIEEKDNRIKELEEQILNQDKNIIKINTELEIYKQREERSTNVVEEIAKQPRVQQNTNNNQKILITSPMDLSQEKMKDMIDNSFNANYMIQGQKGVAKFAYDTILKDEEGRLKYICTDPSRQIFQYKNGEGEIQKDVKAKKLTKALLDGELKSTSHKIASDKMKDNSDDFLEYSTYYLDIKDLEDDNSDFSKELSTLVI